MKFLVFLIICGFSVKVYSQDQYSVKLVVEVIPKVKNFTVKGEVSIYEDLFIFKPGNSRIYKDISISKEELLKIFQGKGLLGNKFTASTGSECYTFFSIKSKEIVQSLEKWVDKSDTTFLDRNHAFLLKRYPFIFPIILDYNFGGELSIDEDYLTFIPVVNPGIIREIVLPLSEIKKVKISGYWLFYPRNILKIKTQEDVYRFTMQNPKQIKKHILK